METVESYLTPVFQFPLQLIYLYVGGKLKKTKKMKKPKNHGKVWNLEELEKLKELAKGNRPTGIIAYELQRTEDAIFTKANSENISLKPTNKSPYDRKVSDAKKKKKT